MDLSKINLNYYSFGYSTGLINDNRNNSMNPTISIDKLVEVAVDNGLGGIEFPIDRIKNKDIDIFLKKLADNNINFFIDFENFDIEYISNMIPILHKNNMNKARIKMSNFFGGNRYLINDFDLYVEKFILDLKSILPILEKYNFKLLIENHQDLNSFEIIDIIEKVSTKYIGVNWDIGNSIAKLETPEQFFENTKKYIGNIHLKDYVLIESDNGFLLKRCPIGEGFVNFEYILSKIEEEIGDTSMSIELGAQITRESHYKRKEYWGFDIKSANGCNKTDWEKNESGKLISDLELYDVIKSINFLDKLRENE